MGAKSKYTLSRAARRLATFCLASGFCVLACALSRLGKLDRCPISLQTMLSLPQCIIATTLNLLVSMPSDSALLAQEKQSHGMAQKNS